MNHHKDEDLMTDEISDIRLYLASLQTFVIVQPERKEYKKKGVARSLPDE
jgi:hypothetical protein